MKLIGIDYGRKRLGVATCNSLKITSPAGMVVRTNLAEDMWQLSEFMEDVERIVVGFPKNMDDSCGEMAREAESFGKLMEEYFQLPVVMWDERLTSWQAERALLDAGLSRGQRNKRRDQIAAAIILQSYVDANLP